MAKMIPLTGDQAVAEAMRQIDSDVVAAYPITPQTEIVMTFSSVRGRWQGKDRAYTC